jgi:hypothetical protein
MRFLRAILVVLKVGPLSGFMDIGDVTLDIPSPII